MKEETFNRASFLRQRINIIKNLIGDDSYCKTIRMKSPRMSIILELGMLSDVTRKRIISALRHELARLELEFETLDDFSEE